jgi:hypothetical protein
MPSYTSSLRLIQPATGEYSGTWGTQVNNGLTALVDTSVAGTATITMTAANYTLSNANGAADEARAMFLVLGGTPGASYQVICPAVSKLYFVANNTGFAQTVKTSAGSGISVPNGARMTLRCDGTDVVVAQNYFGSLTLGTALGAASGGTGLTSPGANGNVLLSNGTAWTSSALPPGGLVYTFTTTPVTLTDKQGVLTDTSGGAFTVTLPATPSTGAQVVVADAGNAWGTNNLTVGRNGSTIGGLAENLVCDITGASVQLVYDGTTWEVYAQIGGNSGNVVTLTGTQTLTNKTIEDGVFTNGYTEETVTANTGTAYTISLSNGTVQILTLTGNCTFTLPTATAGKSFMILLKQDGTGGRTATWPASVKWPGSVAPTITSTANRLDKYVFTADGTNWYGSNGGQNYTV